MRKTGLKEMYIVRYADDFRIFCRNKEDAMRTKEAVTAWITERLRLEVSPEKTRIVNVRNAIQSFSDSRYGLDQKAVGTLCNLIL